LVFGFVEKSLTNKGWLARQEWACEEIIEVIPKANTGSRMIVNEIRLACGLNGKWTYSTSCVFGTGSGRGSAPSVFGPVFASRESALIAGLDDLREQLSQAVEHAVEHPDPTNYNIPFMNSVIGHITTLYPKQEEQLSLF
jgi:hypothetical protein